MEASIVLDLSNYSKKLADVIELFDRIGWKCHDKKEFAEFLPENDNGLYNWQRIVLEKDKIFDLISRKESKGEEVGFQLYHKDGQEGITFLAKSTDKILLDISIHRKTINDRNTDFSWYVENIIYRILNEKVRILSYRIDEIED